MYKLPHNVLYYKTIFLILGFGSQARIQPVLFILCAINVVFPPGDEAISRTKILLLLIKCNLISTVKQELKSWM